MIIKTEKGVVINNPSSSISRELEMHDPLYEKTILSANYLYLSASDPDPNDMRIEVRFTDGTLITYTSKEDAKRVQQKIQSQMILQNLQGVIQ